MFKDRDVICFLGDSITAADMWTSEVYQELKKKYKIKCYNCGVSGGRARRAAKYLHSRCLVHNPDYVTVCFGINDIDYACYGNKEENAGKIRNSLNDYKNAIDSIVRDVIASGAKPILCIPSPYDEVSDVATQNYNCQCGLDEVEKILREAAEKYGCYIVDFKQDMLPLLGKRDIIKGDRVHPTDEGQHIMAQVFLRDVGEIEKCDFDTPFVFEEWNEKRHEATLRLKAMNFVEYCALFDQYYDTDMTYEQKKAVVKEWYERHEDKTEFIPTAYLDYIENIDKYDKLCGEIVKLTTF